MKGGLHFGIAVAAMAIVLLWSGCKTQTVYVPTETVKTEYVEKFRHDSVFTHDSILVKSSGDTVFMEKYKYLYKYKTLRDSVYVTDSIQVPYAVKGDTVYVNRMHRWQQMLMLLGAACAGYLVFRILSATRRFLK